MGDEVMTTKFDSPSVRENQHDTDKKRVRMDLNEISEEISALRRDKGYSEEPTQLLALLLEEVGELARAVKPTWSSFYGTFDKENFRDEICDVLILTLAIAQRFDVNVQSSLLERIDVKLARISK